MTFYFEAIMSCICFPTEENIDKGSLQCQPIRALELHRLLLLSYIKDFTQGFIAVLCKDYIF